MIIDCQNWEKDGRACGGTCMIGMHGGRPSLGTCQACPHKNKSLAEIPKPDRIGKVIMRKKGCSNCKPIVIDPGKRSTNQTKNLIAR